MDVWPGDEKQARPGRSPHEAFGGLVPKRLADHEMLRCIGQGSYGQVWLARSMMGVYRAIKIVYRKTFDNHRPFERELAGIRKFEPVSRLHEGFIDVLHVGNNEGEQYFFYIMELADDEVSGQHIDPEHYSPKTLAREIFRRGKISLRESLDLGVAITEALMELHRHGLVHRDIKPSNIIFVNGRAKLGDIGLVAGLDEAHSYVGTEGFIPPEGPGTAQSDLYSLGKVLYEASTGRDRQDFPELPTHWEASPEYPGLLELNEVILQACKPEPSRRYSSAATMHADLLLVLNGKSVRRLRLLERRMANLKRIAGLAALILLSACLVGLQVYRTWRDARDTRQRQVSSRIAHGYRAVEAGNLLAALPDFVEALRSDEGDPKRERTHRLRLGSVLAQCPKLTQLWLGPPEPRAVAFSPDGQWILCASPEHHAEIHDVQTGKLYLQPFAVGCGLRRASFSPDGKLIITASDDQTATIWEMTTLRPVLQLRHSNTVACAEFSSNAERIVTGCDDGSVWIWNVRTGGLEVRWQAHAEGITSVRFSHKGLLIATAAKDDTARIWDPADGKAAGPVLRHGNRVNGVAFSSDDSRLATCSGDRTARVWEVKDGRQIRPDMRHGDSVQTIQFSSDGRWILTAVLDGTAHLWRADDFQPVAVNPVLGHGERVECAALSPDGRLMATGCADGSVRIWDLAGAQVTPTPATRSFCATGNRYLIVNTNRFVVHDAFNQNPVFSSPSFEDTIEKASISASGMFVAIILGSQTHSAAQHIEVYNVDTGLSSGPALKPDGGIAGVALSFDGKRIAAWHQKTAQVWDVGSGRALSSPLEHQTNVSRAFFNAQGDRLVSLSETNALVWDFQAGQVLFTFQPSRPIVHAEFSRDGKYLVTCCSDSTLDPCFAQVFDIATRQPAGPPLWHRDGVLWASFSPDNHPLVTGGEDFLAVVWEFAHGTKLGQPLNHSDQVSAAVFNSDAIWIATSSGDHTARVWDADTHDPITVPLQHPLALTNILFLAHDRAVATTDWQGHSYIWPLPLEAKSVDDLTDLAHLLASTHLDSTPGSSKGSRETIEALWKRLRIMYPEEFSTTTNQILAWHQQQVLDSEKEENWAAAVFHLERELRLKPDDETLKERLKYDRELEAKAALH